MSFNPKVKDFLKEEKDITLIGLYWAGYWRLALCIAGGYIVLAVVLGALGALV